MTTQVSPLNLDPVSAVITHPEALAAFCKVMTADGPQRFDTWPHQSEIFRAVLDGNDVLVLKARQLGVSWCIALLALWWAMAKPGHLIILISIGEREAISLLSKVKFLHKSLPKVIRDAYPLEVDQKMVVELVSSGLNSRILSLPSSSDAGRGETINLLIGDERPSWPNPDDQEASLIPAAADSGQVVLVGTAKGMDAVYDRWMGAPENGWFPIFVGATARPGRDREWVERMRAKIGEKGPQEYPLTPEEAFLASGRCAFDRENLALLSANCCASPIWVGEIHAASSELIPRPQQEGSWWVWQWPQPGRHYLVTADPAGGRSDGDFSVAVVYDRSTWEQVAAYRSHIEPASFAKELVKVGYLYNAAGRPALLAPESNNHGQAVIALLRGWHYPNMFRSTTLDKRVQKAQERLGWWTTEQTRVTLIHALSKGIDEGTLGIMDQRAIAEMHTFVYRETEHGGRFEAEAGKHDDLVMAHGIAAAVLQLTFAADAPDEHTITQIPRQAPDAVTGYTPG